jgi:hypothetical protein
LLIILSQKAGYFSHTSPRYYTRLVEKATYATKTHDELLVPQRHWEAAIECDTEVLGIVTLVCDNVL